MRAALIRACVVAVIVNVALWAFLSHLTPDFYGRGPRIFLCN